MKKSVSLFGLLIVVLFLVACTNAENTSQQKNESNDLNDNVENIENVDSNKNNEVEDNAEPVTIKFLYPYGESGFEANIVERLADVIPDHVTLECVCITPQLEPLQEMNANQIVPDIIFANYGVEPIAELGMLEPIDEYVEKFGLDLSDLNQSVLATYRYMDPENEERLIGLPTFVDTVALLYNKDIFDRFGVDYPDPDVPLTWDEVYELTVSLTGERDGTFYRGLQLGPEGNSRTTVDFALRSFSVNLTDPDTGEVLITELPEFKRFISLMKKFYDIPGYYEPSEEERQTDLFAERTAAMTVGYPGYIRYGLGETPEETEDIDVAPVPVWDVGGKGPQVNAHPLVLNKYSEQKGEAFQVMAAISKAEAIDPLSSPYHEFGPDSEHYDYYKDKNMKAFWGYEGAYPEEKLSKWNGHLNIRKNIARLGDGTMDENQFIRVLAEETEASILEAMAEE